MAQQVHLGRGKSASDAVDRERRRIFAQSESMAESHHVRIHDHHVQVECVVEDIGRPADARSASGHPHVGDDAVVFVATRAIAADGLAQPRNKPMPLMNGSMSCRPGHSRRARKAEGAGVALLTPTSVA